MIILGIIAAYFLLMVIPTARRISYMIFFKMQTIMGNSSWGDKCVRCREAAYHHLPGGWCSARKADKFQLNNFYQLLAIPLALVISTLAVLIVPCFYIRKATVARGIEVNFMKPPPLCETPQQKIARLEARNKQLEKEADQALAEAGIHNV